MAGYVLMYFLRGSLPWQGLRAPNKKVKYQKICAKKLGTPLETLCSRYPHEFSMYLSYCRGKQNIYIFKKKFSKKSKFQKSKKVKDVLYSIGALC